MNTNNVVSNLIQLLQYGTKSSSSLWKKNLKLIINNWKRFNPGQSAGILLAMEKSNLAHTPNGVKIANLLFDNINMYINSDSAATLSAYKLIQLYFQLYYINMLKCEHYGELVKIYSSAVERSRALSTEQIGELLPLIAISSKIPECQLDPQVLTEFYNILITDLRNKLIQTFKPTTTNSLEQISLLGLTLANYQRYNDFNGLLLLIGEGDGDLCSALRLHTALQRIKDKLNVKTQLSTMSSHLDADHLWTSRSQLIQATGQICFYQMYDSPYIKKLYQMICNALEKLHRQDINNIDIYLKCTLNNFNKNDSQYQFIYKLVSTRLINRPHKAHIRWSYPQLTNTFN